MLVIEYKVKAKPSQYKAIDEAIRTVQFIRNKCLRYWMDASKDAKIDRYALNKYSTVLRSEFPFVKALNSMAVQASAERAWSAISRFFENCQAKKHCQSNDLVAYEDLKVGNLLKNHCLAKSIADASWYQFRQWIEHFATKFGKLAVAVPPHYTSQECSQCQRVVKKALSTRTHACVCGCILHRDTNAAINILLKASVSVSYEQSADSEPVELHAEVRTAKSRGGHPQSNATGVGTATLLGESLVEQVLTLNVESNVL